MALGSLWARAQRPAGSNRFDGNLNEAASASAWAASPLSRLFSLVSIGLYGNSTDICIASYAGGGG